MAAVKPDDVLYDLGSGDGRIVIAAIRDFGVERAVGIDIDPRRIDESNVNAMAAGVADRAEFKVADLFQTDFSDADVVTMYLLSRVNLKLRPRLLDELKPGTGWFRLSSPWEAGSRKPRRRPTENGKTHV